ncbi:MAG: hypothetical protein GPJ21_03650 [Microcystis aeruginosa W13-11]|nr:hypothetical protein [Microcystis aeruginosa W13-11]
MKAAIQQFSFQKVTICTDRKRDLTGGKIAIANQCWTGVISAIQQFSVLDTASLLGI